MHPRAEEQVVGLAEEGGEASHGGVGHAQVYTRRLVNSHFLVRMSRHLFISG